MRKTPTPGLRGRYVTKTPFTVDATQVFTCHAIRSFKDIYERGIDVFTTFYKPVNLTDVEFQQDRSENAHIITLISEDNQVVYVPDTYILSYPDLNAVTYQRVVLAVDLGALPDYVDLSGIDTSIREIVDNSIGCTSEVKVGIAPTTGIVGVNDHETKEAARLNRITNNPTTYSKWRKLVEENAALTSEVQRLQQIIVDSGLVEDLPPAP